MHEIVDDPVNISKVSDVLYPLLVKHQYKNNSHVNQLKKQGVMDETTCNNLKSTAPSSGNHYVHKKGIPIE